MSADLPDATLVDRARAGDRAAFGVLVERYQDDLFRYARHMGFDSTASQDILQDAFVRAYRFLGRCGDPSRFDGWLFRIVANLCRTAGARRSRREAWAIDEMPLRDTGPGPEGLAQAAWRAERVREALAGLPEDQREAVILFYLEGCPVREIADRSAVSPSAIKMRLKRARETLKELLAPLAEEVEVE